MRRGISIRQQEESVFPFHAKELVSCLLLRRPSALILPSLSCPAGASLSLTDQTSTSHGVDSCSTERPAHERWAKERQ